MLALLWRISYATVTALFEALESTLNLQQVQNLSVHISTLNQGANRTRAVVGRVDKSSCKIEYVVKARFSSCLVLFDTRKAV